MALMRQAMSLAGSVKTDKKAAASRENGAKGGRPRGSTRSAVTTPSSQTPKKPVGRPRKEVSSAQAPKRAVGRPRKQALVTPESEVLA